MRHRSKFDVKSWKEIQFRRIDKLRISGVLARLHSMQRFQENTVVGDFGGAEPEHHRVERSRSKEPNFRMYSRFAIFVA